MYHGYASMDSALTSSKVLECNGPIRKVLNCIPTTLNRNLGKTFPVMHDIQAKPAETKFSHRVVGSILSHVCNIQAKRPKSALVKWAQAKWAQAKSAKAKSPHRDVKKILSYGRFNLFLYRACRKYPFLVGVPVIVLAVSGLIAVCEGYVQRCISGLVDAVWKGNVKRNIWGLADAVCMGDVVRWTWRNADTLLGEYAPQCLFIFFSLIIGYFLFCLGFHVLGKVVGCLDARQHRRLCGGRDKKSEPTGAE